jgi:hypothetical protein
MKILKVHKHPKTHTFGTIVLVTQQDSQSIQNKKINKVKNVEKNIEII